MEKPNTMESVEPHSGQYSFKIDLRLNAWLGVTAVVYCAMLFLVKRHPEWSPPLRGSLALVPLVPGLLYVRSWVRFIRGLDELQRRIQLEAFLFAALGTVLAGTVIATLNAHDVPLGWLKHGLGLGETYFALFLFWTLGWGIAKCRYQ